MFCKQKRLKDLLHNIYNGFLRFTPLRKNLRFATQKGTFPRIGFIDNEKKNRLEHILGIKINKIEYFEQALTHRSYLPVEPDKYLLSNERLEFLGDAVLHLIVSDYLFSLRANVDEGELTKMRSQIVNKNSLSIFAKKHRLTDLVQMSFSAQKSVETGSESIGADTCEALIGAIYLDSGFTGAKKFILNTLIPVIMNEADLSDTNYKSHLLEYVQALGFSAPKYAVLDEKGPDHNKEFTVAVYIKDKQVGIGKGKSKKQAEQKAAETAFLNNKEKINNLQ